jgi:hypothetical protein
MPERHNDPDRPATFSTISSVQSSQPSALFSDRASTLSDSSVAPADSASQVGYGGRASAPPKQPRGGGNNPDPDAFRHLSISDNKPNPNQSARMQQQQPAANRHAKDPPKDEDRDKPYNRPGNNKPADSGSRRFPDFP